MEEPLSVSVEYRTDEGSIVMLNVPDWQIRQTTAGE
jgi:hypothetical protein